jgi:hypothetical protein
LAGLAGLQSLKRNIVQSPVAERSNSALRRTGLDWNGLHEIHVGVFERVQPLPLFVGNMFGDDVAQLLDQGELPVLGIEVRVDP